MCLHVWEDGDAWLACPNEESLSNAGHTHQHNRTRGERGHLACPGGQRRQYTMVFPINNRTIDNFLEEHVCYSTPDTPPNAGTFARYGAPSTGLPGQTIPNYAWDEYLEVYFSCEVPSYYHGSGTSNDWGNLIQVWDMWHVKFSEVHWRPLVGAKFYNPEVLVYQEVIDVDIDDVPDYYTYLNKRNDYVNTGPKATNARTGPSGAYGTKSGVDTNGNPYSGGSALHDGDYRLYKTGIPEKINDVRTRLDTTNDAYKSFVYMPPRSEFEQVYVSRGGQISKPTKERKPYRSIETRNHYQDLFISFIKPWFNGREAMRNDSTDPNSYTPGKFNVDGEILRLVRSREMFGFIDGKVDQPEWIIDCWREDRNGVRP